MKSILKLVLGFFLISSLFVSCKKDIDTTETNDFKNVADYEVLAELGEEIGLNKTEVLEMLNSDANVFDKLKSCLMLLNLASVSILSIV